MLLTDIDDVFQQRFDESDTYSRGHFLPACVSVSHTSGFGLEGCISSNCGMMCQRKLIKYLCNFNA